jgi:hypothetical protein
MHRLALILAFVAFAFFSTLVHAQNKDDPVALIADIYKNYQAETDPPGYSDVYSHRLQALIEFNAEVDPGKIDWDVFVNGNDWKLSELTLALISKSESKAQVRAQFFNFNDPQDMRFDLLREDGQWVIDEVCATKKDHRWTMSKILTGAPDAFPDQKK